MVCERPLNRSAPGTTGGWGCCPRCHRVSPEACSLHPLNCPRPSKTQIGSLCPDLGHHPRSSRSARPPRLAPPPRFAHLRSQSRPCRPPPPGVSLKLYEYGGFVSARITGEEKGQGRGVRVFVCVRGYETRRSHGADPTARRGPRPSGLRRPPRRAPCRGPVPRCPAAPLPRCPAAGARSRSPGISVTETPCRREPSTRTPPRRRPTEGDVELWRGPPRHPRPSPPPLRGVHPALGQSSDDDCPRLAANAGHPGRHDAGRLGAGRDGDSGRPRHGRGKSPRPRRRQGSTGRDGRDGDTSRRRQRCPPPSAPAERRGRREHLPDPDPDADGRVQGVHHEHPERAADARAVLPGDATHRLGWEQLRRLQLPAAAAAATAAEAEPPEQAIQAIRWGSGRGWWVRWGLQLGLRVRVHHAQQARLLPRLRALQLQPAAVRGTAAAAVARRQRGRRLDARRRIQLPNLSTKTVNRFVEESRGIEFDARRCSRST